MHHYERVRAALRGEPVDHPPYGFWTHFPLTDLDPAALAQETIRFVRELDLDFVKTMPNGQFCTEDWGTVSDFSEIARGGVAKILKAAIESPEDWLRIGRLDVRSGAFGRELEHLRRVCDALSNERPVLATAFSPITIAQKLAGPAYLQHLESHPDWVKAALANIAATLADFVAAALDIGCCGIFFATQESSTCVMSEANYREFGVPYDDVVIESAQAGWFNVIHMHGEDVMFELLKGYSVTALNWHIGETAPLLSDYAKTPGRKPVLGGLRRTAITEMHLDAIVEDIGNALAATGGHGLLFAPGCVIRHPVNHDFLRRVIDKLSRSPVS